METGKTLTTPSLSPQVLIKQSTALPVFQPVVQPAVLLDDQLTSTSVALGPLIDPDLDLYSGPVDVPLELQIPSLEVDVPVVGVGLIKGNIMDAPKGAVGDSIWQMAYWYRGSGIPGEVGTATIAGHVNNSLGLPSIFTNLHKLRPGDLIIIHYTKLNIDIRFIVDQRKNYTLLETSYPGVLTKIFGVGPVAGIGPQPALDGLSHLTLITCAGDLVESQFDQRTVIYAILID